MNDAVLNKSTALAAALLTYYGTEGTRLSVRVKLLARWLKLYPEPWVRAALIESIYQGRYKTISVEQLLDRWQHRGYPVCHFNSEFARLICQNIPRELARFPEEKRDHGFSRKSYHREQPVVLPEPNSDAPCFASTSAMELPSELESKADLPQLETTPSSAGADGQQPQEQREAIAEAATVTTVLDDPASEWALVDQANDTIADEFEIFEMGKGNGSAAIESIHPFILESESDEFCEKLMAIASRPH
jgi:hypothetical protein